METNKNLRWLQPLTQTKQPGPGNNLCKFRAQHCDSHSKAFSSTRNILQKFSMWYVSLLEAVGLTFCILQRLRVWAHNPLPNLCVWFKIHDSTQLTTHSVSYVPSQGSKCFGSQSTGLGIIGVWDRNTSARIACKPDYIWQKFSASLTMPMPLWFNIYIYIYIYIYDDEMNTQMRLDRAACLHDRARTKT